MGHNAMMLFCWRYRHSGYRVGPYSS